jgi:hypothetical protein
MNVTNDPFGEGMTRFDELVQSPFGDYYASRPKSVKAIEGVVETDEQVRERQRHEKEVRIRVRRREIAEAAKVALRDLDQARLEYRWLRVALTASSIVTVGVALGWIMAVSWAVATNITGGRGGPFTLYVLLLIVVTVLAGIGLVASVIGVHDKHKAVTKAMYRHADALEAGVDYETALTQGIETT